jgi:sulfide:quinone oxidoreductase
MMQTIGDSHQVLILGGGASGIAVAAELSKRDPNLDIGVVERSDVHHAKALWSALAGGIYESESTRRPLPDVLPNGVKWIGEGARGIDPDEGWVELDSGSRVGFDCLIVCTGVDPDWTAVAGLAETIGKNDVCSVYSSEHAIYTWETLKALESGDALFVVPPNPSVCAASSLELMFLTADNLDQRGRLDRTRVDLFSPDPARQHVPLIDGQLKEVVDRYGIGIHRSHELVEVDGASRTAVFEFSPTDRTPERVERSFDLLHVVPRQRPGSLIASSGLGDEEGWLDVNLETLQHSRHDRVFGAGDVVGGTFLRSVFGVSAQAGVVASNVLRSISGSGEPLATVDGREDVVISTGYSRAVRLHFSEPAGSTRKPDVTKRGDGLLTYWKFKRSLPRRYWTEVLKARG